MRAIYFIVAILTSMVGYTIHSSLFWSITDFFFWPWAWAKWFIYHEVNLEIIRHTFYWFF